MKKALAALVLVGVLVGVAVVAYRQGWLPRVPSQNPPANQGAGTPASVPAQAANEASTPAADGATNPASAPEKLPVFDGNIADMEWGGKMESIKGADATDERTASHPLRGLHYGTDELGKGPQEFVISFFERESALVDRVEVVGFADPTPANAPRDVEVWTSATSPTAGFTKVAAQTLPPEGSGSVRFSPVEARFVKLRILNSQSGDDRNIHLLWIKVFEAQRAGYVPLLSRRADIMGPLAATTPGATPVKALGAAPACEPEPAAPTPGRSESRKILVLSDTPQAGDPEEKYGGIRLKSQGKERTTRSDDLAIFDRAQMVLLATDLARPYHLSEKNGFDTVVMEQVCTDNYPLAPSFKKALIAWVAAGHKLIIHDADKCAPGPDYSWLPYKIKTDNPGAQGAKGDSLAILEDNWMAHNRKGRPGFIDSAAWVADAEGYSNELGDSNTVVEWGPGWCGHIVVRNVAGVFGFAGAYAHYGRGLIIYNGFDVDMVQTTGYDILIARELAQGFAPDNLPCSARIGSFVITTDPTFRYQPLVPGKPLTYPLTLLSNQKYKGTVTLSAGASPALNGLQARFEPATVAVSDLHKGTLTLTVPPGTPVKPTAIEVKGTDTDGKTNSLCLQLGPPRWGELAIKSELTAPAKSRKNLEIILDASGSMKTPLAGKKSRWDVALETLRLVLEKLPDDFNVGLRIYGHREGSRSPKTCTDSELIVPVGPIDRQGILEKAKAFKPKGETPLVYSALQAPLDLKEVGGGTVILITDGEESCKGDPVKAATTLKASGLDIRLNIVGFALSNPKTQKDLSGFAVATGGRFYPAQNGQALADALLIAAIDRFPYTVFDATGKVVAQGEAGAGAEQLPDGEYRVVVKAGAQELVAPRVKVVLGQTITLSITSRNDQLVVQ